MHNKLIIFVSLLAALTSFPLYAAVETLNPDKHPSDCKKFSQSKTVISLHGAGDPIEQKLKDLSEKTQYSNIFFYQYILANEAHPTPFLCGKTPYDPGIFIVDAQGKPTVLSINFEAFTTWLEETLNQMI